MTPSIQDIAGLKRVVEDLKSSIASCEGELKQLQKGKDTPDAKKKIESLTKRIEAIEAEYSQLAQQFEETYGSV